MHLEILYCCILLWGDGLSHPRKKSMMISFNGNDKLTATVVEICLFANYRFHTANSMDPLIGCREGSFSPNLANSIGQ
jgi:hypothetical protein